MPTYFLAIEKYIEILPNLKAKDHSYVNLPIATFFFFFLHDKISTLTYSKCICM